MHKIEIISNPIIIRYDSCHQPEIPISCSLLDVTDIEGHKIITLKIKVNGPIGFCTLSHSLSLISIPYVNKVG